MDYPKLRSVNAFPVQVSGQTVIHLQDPLAISEKSLFLPGPVYFIVSLFDGQHSLLDIQAEYMRQFGEFLFTDRIQEIVTLLEENFYLEGDRYREALREREEQFKKAPLREPFLAGKSYEGDPLRLQRQLEQYFQSPEGPGPLGERKGGNGLKGVVAPHIDFQRGGFCYAFAHREIGERNTSRCFVIFGTAHVPTTHPFTLTKKDFATPLGTLKADVDLIEGIESRCQGDLYLDEGVHRGEHSIEFQCLFLRYLYPEPTPLTIVPVLCGSFHEAIERGISPMEWPVVREFIEALREAVSSRGESVCYIASADLAHVGLQFGHREGMSEYGLRVLEAQDLEMLGHAEKLDGEGFFSTIAKEGDRRNICGLPAIYSLLQVVDAKEGKILKYGQAFTRETQSVVSFASLAFY